MARKNIRQTEKNKFRPPSEAEYAIQLAEISQTSSFPIISRAVDRFYISAAFFWILIIRDTYIRAV